MRILLLALGFTLLTALPSFAAPAEDVQRAESYLNSLATLQARFIQTGPDGQQVAGNFYLKRPGRMRFEYDPPITDFIVADGTFIHYYDGELKQTSNAPVSHSLADFFLRPDLKLSGNITVADVQRGGNLLQITLTQTDDPLAGSLVLGLAENPLSLKKWRVIDAQGLVTEVELFDTKTGIALDPDLFRFYDPSRKTPNYN